MHRVRGRWRRRQGVDHPRQYTANSAVFYSFQCYQIKISTYNLTYKRNRTDDIRFYDHGLLRRQPSRDSDLSFGELLWARSSQSLGG